MTSHENCSFVSESARRENEMKGHISLVVIEGCKYVVEETDKHIEN